MRALAALALLLAGCTKDEPQDSGPEDSGPELDAATVTLHGACPMETDFGGFSLTVAEESSDLAGSVADGVVPVSVLEEVAAEGDCRLMRRNNPFCEGGCEPWETCDFDGSCVDYPSNQDLGTVRVSGLVKEVSMEPVFPGNTYFDTTLPHPAAQADTLVSLRMPGGVYGPLRLNALAVDPLHPGEELWTIESGQDLTVHWEAPTGLARSEVLARINVDVHGASPGSLYCIFADDGEGTVPGSIITALVEAGVTGFPSGALERRTVDSGTLPGGGCMDFSVSSPRLLDVDVVGFTPCVSDEDCPDGLDCNEEFQICE